MASDSCHMSIVQYKDLICIEDRTDTLCHDNGCCFFCIFFQSFSKCAVCFKIQCGKAVVKDKDLRILCDSSGNGKPLLLSTGNIASSLCDRSLISLRLGVDKLRSLCNLCCFFHCVFRNLCLSVTDIGINGS